MEIHENMTSGAYCRLCAHYDQVNTLIDLNVDKEKYEEITSALSLLNATYVNLSKNNGLYLTICADCYYFLSKTHEFLCKVKNAQHTLASLSLSKEVLSDNKIFTKKEESSDEFCYDPIEISLTAIKTETDDCHISDLEVKFNLEDSSCNVKNPFESIDNKIVKKENDGKTQKPTAIKNEMNSRTDRKCSQFEHKYLLTFSQNTKSTNISEVFDQNTNLTKNIDELSSQNTNSSKFDTNDSDDNFGNIPDIEFDIITKRFTCEICNKNFGKRQHRDRHRINVHKVVPQKKKRHKIHTVEDLTCKYCKKVYANPSRLSYHIQGQHNQNQETYICDHCGKQCLGKQKFNAHLARHNPKTHICRICNQSFIWRSQLVDHVRCHTNVKQFECDHCGWRSVTKKAIQRHITVHSDLKPFECNICQKAFKRYSYFKNHMRVHNNDSTYECKPCKMRFSCWGNCNKHMKRKHNTTLKKGNKGSDKARTTEEETSNMDLEEWKRDVLGVDPRQASGRQFNSLHSNV